MNVYLNLSIFNVHYFLIYSFTECTTAYVIKQCLNGTKCWFHHFCAARVNDVDMTWVHITILLGINWIQADETKRCMRLHSVSSWKLWYHFITQCMNYSSACNMHHKARYCYFRPGESLYGTVDFIRTNLETDISEKTCAVISTFRNIFRSNRTIMHVNKQ